MSDSVRPHRWQPTRLHRPWDSPGKNTGVGCHFLLQCMKVKNESEVTESCPILSDPMDCSLPDSSVHGSFQARVLEWGAITFSKGLYSKALIINKWFNEENVIYLYWFWINSVSLYFILFQTVQFLFWFFSLLWTFYLHYLKYLILYRFPFFTIFQLHYTYQFLL